MPPRAFVLPKQGVRPETDSYAKSALQGAVQSAQRNANTVPWSDGKLIKDVVVPALSYFLLAHGLGRTPAGWIVVRAVGSNAIIVTDAADITADTIRLFNSSGLFNATVDLWVF